jgi:hypothetical protein
LEERMQAMADQQKQKGASGFGFIMGIFSWIFGGFVLSLFVSGFLSRKN